MKRTRASLVAALMLSCAGGSARVDVVVPVASGLHECSPTPAADAQDGDCYFAADGKLLLPEPNLVTAVTAYFVAADGTTYSTEQQMPAEYLVADLSVHVEATRLKNARVCPGSCGGVQIIINTISK